MLPLDVYRPFLLLAKEDVGHRSVKFTFELPEGNELVRALSCFNVCF